MKRSVFAGAAAVCAGAAGAQVSFTPVNQTSVPEPRPDVIPLNAPQVILGRATRYVANTGFPNNPGSRIVVSSDGATFTELPYPDGGVSARAVGVSEDGRKILGRVGLQSAGASVRAATWGEDNVPSILPLGVSSMQEPVGMSRDGLTIGYFTGVGFPTNRSFLWSASSGSIAIVPGDEDLHCRLTCLSANGAACSGRWNDAQPFVWAASGNAHVFGASPWTAAFVSNSGNTIASTWGGRYFLYSINFSGTILFLSPDGTVALGQAGYDPLTRARFWTPWLGAVDLQPELEARGVDVQGWTLTQAYYLSDDRATFVGRGKPPGSSDLHWWVARVDPISPADIGRQGGIGGGDGQLDANDLVVYLNRFFAQDWRADVGKQGGIAEPDGVFDSNDFVVYLSQFFAANP